jgi:RimJ/RimL family protein N-acetyltransferase
MKIHDAALARHNILEPDLIEVMYMCLIVIVLCICLYVVDNDCNFGYIFVVTFGCRSYNVVALRSWLVWCCRADADLQHIRDLCTPFNHRRGPSQILSYRGFWRG